MYRWSWVTSNISYLRIAALLHRAADMDHKPTIKETRFLLPKPALSARDIKPPQWVNMVQSSWDEGVSKLSTTHAKQKVLETLSVWPLFGSSFFAVSKKLSLLSIISIVSWHNTLVRKLINVFLDNRSDVSAKERIRWDLNISWLWTRMESVSSIRSPMKLSFTILSLR